MRIANQHLWFFIGSAAALQQEAKQIKERKMKPRGVNECHQAKETLYHCHLVSLALFCRDHWDRTAGELFKAHWVLDLLPISNSTFMHVCLSLIFLIGSVHYRLFVKKSFEIRLNQCVLKSTKRSSSIMGRRHISQVIKHYWSCTVCCCAKNSVSVHKKLVLETM